MWNHFSSFPSVRFRRPGGGVRRESQSSSAEPVFLIPSGVRLGTAEAGGRLGESRVFFSAEPVFLVPFGLDWRRRESQEVTLVGKRGNSRTGSKDLVCDGVGKSSLVRVE
jgi:hypothetical protein